MCVRVMLVKFGCIHMGECKTTDKVGKKWVGWWVDGCGYEAISMVSCQGCLPSGQLLVQM